MQILIMAGQLILGLSILVGLHELGHLLAARAFGMRVEQYYIGFPPKVFSFKRGDTEYGLGAIPLGGFVKISGMIDESLDTTQMAGPPKPYEFRAKPAWQRLIVMLGGIIVNVIVGIIIFVALTYKNGNEYIANKDVRYGISAGKLAQEIGLKDGDKILKVNGKPIVDFDEVRSSDVFLGTNSSYEIERNGKIIDIDIPNDFVNKLTDKKSAGQFIEPRLPFKVKEVMAGTPAAKVGLAAGDQITRVNQTPIQFYHEVKAALDQTKGKTVALGVVRAGQPLTLNPTVTPEGTVGFVPDMLLPTTREQYTFGQALQIGTGKAFKTFFDQIKGFGKLFRGDINVSKGLSGPGKIARDLFGGVWIWDRFWFATGILSLALAFTNLLPIPALDGGHSVILLYEIVSGRKPSDKFIEISQRVGMVFLLGLMAFVLFNDAFDIIFRS
jgi:regulator of sigma E protease